jgi:protocatechuate 3,4-dioxygenase beta subunit
MTNRMSRRQALAGFGAVSLGSLLAACGGDDEGTPAATTDGADTAATTAKTETDPDLAKLFEDAPSCSLTPEQTEGPYYFDADKIRSDIREGHEGSTLRLALQVRTAGDCKPLRDAVVDIWHCDALGDYSAEGETFCRGAQATNSDGIVEFRTVYPGWYQGRTVHIHAKVHVDNETVLTTQLNFDDDFTAKVFDREPYSQRPDRDTFNADDSIFDEATLLKLSEDGDGYLGVLALDVEAA